MKQETLEEASKRAVKSGLFKDETLFIAGAKWQQEQDKNKYSEEEVLELLLNLPNYFISTHKEQRINEWFEQSKKK